MSTFDSSLFAMDELLAGKYAIAIAVGVAGVVAMALFLKQYSAGAAYEQPHTASAGKKKRNKKKAKKQEELQIEALSRSLGDGGKAKGSNKANNAKGSAKGSTKSNKSNKSKKKGGNNNNNANAGGSNLKPAAAEEEPVSAAVEDVEAEADLDYSSFVTGENKVQSETQAVEKVGRKNSEAAKQVMQRAAGGLDVALTEYVTEFNEDEWTTVENTFKKKDNEVIRFSEFSYDKIMSNAKAKNLLTKSSPRVDVDKHLGTITIHGEPDEVSKAREGFNSIMTELQAYEDSKRDEVVVLGDKWYVLAGAKFENFKRIQDKTGARLQLDKETNDLTISGFHKQVDDALVEVDRALNPPPPAHSIQIPVTRHHILAILGQGGKVIQGIQKETGAKLDLDGEKTDDVRNLTISGEQKEVMAAHNLVSTILRDNGFEKVVPLTNNGVQLLFYNNGEQLKGLRTKSGTASIQVDRDAMKVTITGEKAKVDELADAVYLIINSPPKAPTLKDGEVFEAIELGDYVAAVAGKGFSNVTSVKTKYGVSMDIPPTTTACWIWGNSKKVLQAKAEVMELMKKMDDKKDKKAKSEEGRAQFMNHQQNATAELLMRKDPAQQWGGSLPVGW